MPRASSDTCRRLLATLLTLASLASCADDGPRLLPESVVHSRPDLVEAAAPGPGRLAVVGDAGFEVIYDLPGATHPRIAVSRGERVHLVSGDSLRVIPAPDSGGVRGGMSRSVVVGDPLGRFLLQGASSGAVIAHEPDTLDPIWAWASLDAATTALALAPWADRLYQAVEPDGGDPRLLVRDLQTGRTLTSVPLDAPAVALATDDRGRLFAVQREGGDLEVLRIDPGREDLDVLWRQRVGGQGERGASASLAVAAGRVVLWGEAVRWGVVTLDPEHGSVTARSREPPLDAAVDPAGNIWALYPGELRRLGSVSAPRRRRSACGGSSRRQGRGAC